MKGKSQKYLYRVRCRSLLWAVGALIPGALGDVMQTVSGDPVPADQHHWGVQLRGLLLADWADEDGMVDHRRRERGLECQLIHRRPLRLLLLHVCGVFQ